MGRAQRRLPLTIRTAVDEHAALWEGDGVDGDAASALFELLERPECLGDDDRTLIEDFRMFLDQDR